MTVLLFRFSIFFFDRDAHGAAACKKDTPVQPVRIPEQNGISEIMLLHRAALKLSVSGPARPQPWELRRDDRKS